MTCWRKTCFGMIAQTILFVFGALAANDEVRYGQEIRPILAKHCLACHGRDKAARKGDLRLDLREAAISGGAFQPGDASQSELISRIASNDPDQRMPPPSTGHVLTVEEKKRLRDWVDQGAPYEKHWAFQLPVKRKLPKVSQPGWARSPIDYFVLEKLDAIGLGVSPDAEKLTWLRRVSLDLTGLPPTLAEAKEFMKDPGDDADQRVVKRLLESAAFGEHWARMWLDLARYADTKGYEKDRHREIWRYRDWVIDALNADMPYDRFTLEQLGGDLLPNRTNDQVLATGFHRNTMTNEEGGTDNEEFRVAAVKDRVDTTLQVWMGLTMGCAKCHTHKYDPISIDDYYAFYAIFNQTQDNDTEGPFWPTPTRAQSRKIDKLKQEIAGIAERAKSRSRQFRSEFANWKRQFESKPLWLPLKLKGGASKSDVKFEQNLATGNIVAAGKRPDKDTWKFTFELPRQQKATSLRIDSFPKSTGGGDWPDANVAIRELSVEFTGESGKSQKLKLQNPRASFSQRGWEVHKAIDGKTNVGWALSPKFSEPQVAVFDFERPIEGGTLTVTLEQEYGEGLLLARSRFSVSTYQVAWNLPEPVLDLEELFANQVFPETRNNAKKLASLKKQLADLQSRIPKTPVLLELDPRKRRVTKIHQRGNFLQQTEIVKPAVLEEFGEFPKGAPLNRLGVARWLMSGQNPLTARVMVNRVWARVFGIGLVETEEDFGTQGQTPSHLEMLDWLAVDFREKDWSIKKLLRTIVLSRTYRQTSSTTKVHLEKDPRNRLLGRGPRFRLPAEVIRDQALAVSGLLARKIGGPSVMPPQPEGVWKSTYNGQKWQNAVGEDRYRRGIYIYLKRTSPYPAMQTFDAGSGEVCQTRRIRTNTPLQALVTLNDQAFIEAAGALARQMDLSSKELKGKLINGFRRVLSREPNPGEIERISQFYKSLNSSTEDNEKLLTVSGWKQGDAKLVMVANVLLNLDETVTKP